MIPDIEEGKSFKDLFEEMYDDFNKIVQRLNEKTNTWTQVRHS